MLTFKEWLNEAIVPASSHEAGKTSTVFYSNKLGNIDKKIYRHSKDISDDDIKKYHMKLYGGKILKVERFNK
jgi:hypothetical protein